ncbi:MAG: hypothetical protein JW791_03845 [Nanoarchaeota archaeon]|nr:hypothetical protein [Nanoarchaeota archaeon]
MNKKIANFIKLSDKLQRVMVVLFILFLVPIVLYSLSNFTGGVTVLEMQLQLILVTILFIIFSAYCLLVIIGLVIKHFIG